MKKNFVGLNVFISLFFLGLFLPAFSADLGPQPFDAGPGEISMDFQDANLKDILKVFSIQSGLNFIASEALQDRKITLYLDKVPLKKAMDKLFKANNLSYELDRSSGIFIIKEWGKLQAETETRVFYLKYATVSSSSLEQEKTNNLASAASGASGAAGASTSGMIQGGSAGGTSEEESGITSAIKKLLSADGSVIEDSRTNSLIVTDTPNRMQVIARVIDSLDVSVPQVMLEVEMLDVSKNTVDKMGVNWPTILASLDVTGQRTTNFPFLGNKADDRKWLVTDEITSPSGNWKFNNFYSSHFLPSVLTVIGANLTLDFLRTQSDTKILARPRIMTLNNQTAEIKITTQEAVGSISTSQAVGSASPNTTSAERVETGVTLRVTPQINLAAGDVTMFINPTVKDTATSTLSSSYKDPEERSTKSVVRIRDGETVVIGGLIRNDMTRVETKVPILGDIPLIGGLFRHKGGTTASPDKNRERELLVFITPHIIKEAQQIKLAKTTKVMLPEREQERVPVVVNRASSISSSLNSFEKAQR